MTFEEGAVAYDHQDAAGFIKLNALRLRTLAKRKKKAAKAMMPQRRARFGFAFLAVLVLSGAPSRADDSTASLRAGGLALEKTDKIALVSEDLYLSPTAVKVAYRFRNLTNADVETIVAFPMPDVTGSVDMAIAIPDPANDNFLGFVTRVDGKPVNSQVEQRAFLTAPGKPEVEITERLKSLGVPLVPTVEAAGAALSALSAPQRKALADAGIVYPLDVDVGKGAHVDWVPLWTLRSKFWRKQVFPAGRDLLVEQTYTPGTGSQSTLSFGAPDLSAAQAVALSRDVLHGRTLHERRPVPLPQGQRAQRHSSAPSKNICPMSSPPAPIGRGRSEPSALSSTRAIRRWSRSAAMA